MKYKFTKHALDRMIDRGIQADTINDVLKNPAQIIIQDQCTHIYQSSVYSEQKSYLYRIFVNICEKPALIITVYKTSKIDKYNEN